MAVPISTKEFSSNVTNHTLNSNVAFDLAYWEHIFTAILVGLIAVMGIVGNSMIIAAVAFSHKLQTSTNAFITSLSVADLLTSSFMIWYAVGLLGQNHWPLPRVEWLCAATGFVIYTCVGASIYTLAAISVNRLVLITKPNVYQRIFTSWKLCLLVTLPWFIPCSSSTIAVLTGLGAFGYDRSALTCSDLDLRKNGDLFNFAQAMVALPIPLVTIVISYVWIYVYLKKHFRKQKANLAVAMNKRSDAIQISHKNTEGRVSTGENVTSEQGIINNSCDTTDEPSKVSTEARKSGSNTTEETLAMLSTRKREQISCQQIEITKNLFIVICAFFACFVPFMVLNPVLETSRTTHYMGILPLANSTINFMIYARKHPDFKVVLGCLMKCSYADIPQPTRLLKFLLSKTT